MTLIPISRRKDVAFAPGTYDVRGWLVRTQLDDEKVGKVDDIIVDADGRPHYLDVDLRGFDRHVLVPMHRAHPAAENEVVWVEGLSRDRIGTLPAYAHDVETLTPAYESRLADAWDAAVSGRTDPARPMERTSEGAYEYARLGAMEDYRVASADTDPRGWTVVAGDGRKIGEVKELIIETSTMSARYLDCDVDEKDLELEPIDRHVLIPVRRARLDADHRKVIVDGVFSTDLTRYPVYGGLPLTDDFEHKLEAVYGPYDERTADRDTEAHRRSASAAGGEGREGARDVRVQQRDQEVLIRVTGDDVIIEKRPRA